MNPDIIIYALVKSGAIIYVGRTSQIRLRVWQHRHAGKVFDDVQTLAVCHTREDASKKELHFIKKHRPQLNKIIGSNGSYMGRRLGNPISVKLGAVGARLSAFCQSCGFDRPPVLRLAMAELFKSYPDDKALALAVYQHRATEAAK